MWYRERGDPTITDLSATHSIAAVYYSLILAAGPATVRLVVTIRVGASEAFAVVRERPVDPAPEVRFREFAGT